MRSLFKSYSCPQIPCGWLLFTIRWQRLQSEPWYNNYLNLLNASECWQDEKIYLISHIIYLLCTRECWQLACIYIHPLSSPEWTNECRCSVKVCCLLESISKQHHEHTRQDKDTILANFTVRFIYEPRSFEHVWTIVFVTPHEIWWWQHYPLRMISFFSCKEARKMNGEIDWEKTCCKRLEFE